ncbi:MAG: hypothetical protein KAH95_16865 [Spirochaetales bacterium]|nr:hypothetical protein [Spirochaetales bacterium]
MKDIKILLSELKGVISVSKIEDKNKDIIIKLEKNYEKNGVAGLQNPGIRMVLQSDVVYAILKDTSFRQAPGSTVYMVEDLNSDDKKPDYTLTINNKSYSIIGEELINKKFPKDEEYMFISDDFILYPERRKGRAKNPAYFLIPPLEFAELEAVKKPYKIKNIISVSPSTMSDDFIRKLYDFSLRNDYATILIGFNKTTQEPK